MSTHTSPAPTIVAPEYRYRYVSRARTVLTFTIHDLHELTGCINPESVELFGVTHYREED